MKQQVEHHWVTRRRVDISKFLTTIFDTKFGANLKNELGVTRESGRENGRQREGFVEGVCMQRLGSAENGGHGLHASADDVVVRVLLGE